MKKLTQGEKDTGLRIGKAYDFFDDGKISPSRLFRVKIQAIIPFSEAGQRFCYCGEGGSEVFREVYGTSMPTLADMWRHNWLEYPRLLDHKTDYLVVAEYVPGDYEPSGCSRLVFARSHGGWYTIDPYNNGRLDHDGSMRREMKARVAEVKQEKAKKKKEKNK